MTHLGLVHSTQPPRNDLKRLHRVIGPWRRHVPIEIAPGKLKIERINDKKQQNVERTHLGRENTAQPLGNPPECRYGVHRPRRRHGRIKSIPKNVSQMQNGGNAYLGRAIAIRSIWRPIKGIRRLEELTFESRMPGEPWRDVEDHGWADARVAINRGHMPVQHDLPNWATTRKSCKRHKPLQQQVSYSIRIGLHIHLQHIILHLAKYIHWITLPYLSFHYPTSFMGECWI